MISTAFGRGRLPLLLSDNDSSSFGASFFIADLSGFDDFFDARGFEGLRGFTGFLRVIAAGVDMLIGFWMARTGVAGAGGCSTSSILTLTSSSDLTSFISVVASVYASSSALTSLLSSFMYIELYAESI